MGISYDGAYARQRGDFPRRALRVTAGYQNPAGGVLPVDAADGGAYVLVGRRGHGAGIQNHDFGLLWRARRREAVLPQLALQNGAIGLSGAATEVLNIESAHSDIIGTTLDGRSGPAAAENFRNAAVERGISG
jgi:hypothetical protein